MTPASALDLYAKPQTLVDVGGGRKLNLCVSGEGAPTIVLAHGGGGATVDWHKVQPALSAQTRVVSYDRAGSGFSDPAPAPRTTSAIIDDLRIALKAVEIGPPYILVGHSSGSFDARLFTFKYPEEVVGLVLVDPSGDHQEQRFSAAGAASDDDALSALFESCAACAERGALLPGTEEYRKCVSPPNPDWPVALNEARLKIALSGPHWRCLNSEMREFDGASSDELRAARRSLGTMPVIVLTAGRVHADRRLSPEQQAAKEAVWVSIHDEFAALSSGGRRETVDGAGHYIQLDKPDAVIAALNEVLGAARA